tara:strand:- start:731 stop:955 length:225 start_codon:yes stop_codon:yes gene_type:complete
MLKAPSPGFLWHEIYCSVAKDKLGNELAAEKHISIIKKVLNSSKISALEKHFEFWSVEEVFSGYEPIFKKYGFI